MASSSVPQRPTAPSTPAAQPPILPTLLLPSTNPKSAAPRAQLTHIATIAHLLHVRNKNQHRRSHWYRHFNVFRRELHRVCAELYLPLPHRDSTPSDGTAPPTAAGKTEKRRGKETADKVERRLRWWLEAALPGAWWDAFSHVVGTTQYSGLGLVLLGVLAQAMKLVGVTTALQNTPATSVDQFATLAPLAAPDDGWALALRTEAARDVGEGQNVGERALDPAALKREAKDETELARLLRKFEREEADSSGLSDTGLKRRQEKGQRKKRKALEVSALEHSADNESLTSKQPKEPELDSGKEERRNKHGKKKRKNAIDDLFAGL